MIAITSGSSSTSSSSSTMMWRSDFCVCAKEASPGATVLKNALVKNGALFSFFGFGTGLFFLAVFFFDEGVDSGTCGAAEDLWTSSAAEDLVTCGAAEDFVTCGAAEDLVSCGAVEVDGSCLIGDRVRGGSFALLSSSGSNAVLQKSAVSQ